MPASLKDDVLISHGGLTFGGVVSGSRMKTPQMLEIFESLIEFARQNKLKRNSLQSRAAHLSSHSRRKKIYTRCFGSTPDCAARCFDRSIQPRKNYHSAKGENGRGTQSRKSKIEVRESVGLSKLLCGSKPKCWRRNTSVVPVHTAAEMKLLANIFPEHIGFSRRFYDECNAGGRDHLRKPNRRSRAIYGGNRRR